MKNIGDYPKVLDMWHPTKNKNLDPNTIPFFSHKKFWWRCTKEPKHEWQARCSKQKIKGKGCPYCSNLLVNKTNSLLTTHPEFAKTWHPTKNGKKTPEDVTYGSEFNAWWQCPKEKNHIFQARVWERTRAKHLCPYCTRQTSHPEIRIYCELKNIFDQISSRKKINGFEADILIDDLKIIVEYDGAYFHKDKEKKDELKTKSFSNLGYSVVRVRCKPLKKITKYDLIVKSDEIEKKDIDNLVKKIVEIKYSSINTDVLHKTESYFQKKDFTNAKLFNKYISYLPSPFPEHSLDHRHPKLSKIWDYEKNYPLTPRNFLPRSNKTVWWKCDLIEEHKWQRSIDKMVARGGSCPFCIGKRVDSTNALSTTHPEIANQWHSEKNGNLTPKQFTKGSHQNIWWNCSKNKDHTWNQSIKNRVNSKTVCPICSNRVTKHGTRTFFVMDLDGKILAEYSNQKKCARDMNFSSQKISSCLNGKRKTHAKHMFKYKDDF